ncbi:MAG: hypothetical protein J6R54_08265 [Bacteroidaceae bacterium]|nr:hypothetical protein [Bacteroidaceae bacterium]
MLNNNYKKQALQNLKNAESEYKKTFEMFCENAMELHRIRQDAAKAIKKVEQYFNLLANKPKEFESQIADINVELEEFNESARIENECARAGGIAAGTALGGAVLGGAVAAYGPKVALALATTYGKTSNGKPIADLKGGAAKNAATACLGGGAKSAGGGGIEKGNKLLGNKEVVGGGVALFAIACGSFYINNKNKKAAKAAEKETLGVSQATAQLRIDTREVENLINETKALLPALRITMMVNTYPSDYNEFNMEQKKNFAALINATHAMGQLINKKVN